MIDHLFELSRQMVARSHRPYRRYLMEGGIFSGRGTIVTGARGVGKTTCLVQHLVDGYPDYAHSRQCLYLPADHFVVAQMPLYEIAGEFAQTGGQLLCLDEVHKVPTWSRDLKSILDTFPQLRVAASGSSMLHLQHGTHDLSRRMAVHRLAGLSFREFLAIRRGVVFPALDLDALTAHHEREAAAIVARLEAASLQVLAEFRDYLACGYYPYFLEYPDRAVFHAVLEQSMHAALESDLPALHPALTGNSVARLKRLLAAVAAHVPFTPDLVKLRALCEVGDDRTLKEYLRNLEDAGLIMAVHRAGGRVRSMEKPDKLYLGDPNQCYALAASGNPDAGSVRETFFCRMLLTAHRVQSSGKGDFLVDERRTFEVGGKSKGFSQIAGLPSAWLAVDGIPAGAGTRVPLWLFGFLY